MLQRLELRGQHHEDEDERQRERSAEGAVLLVERLDLPVVDDVVARRQLVVRHCLAQRGGDVAERGPAGELGVDGDLPLPVLVLDHARPVLQRHPRHVGELAQSFLREEVHGADAVRVVPIAIRQAHADVRLVLALPQLRRHLALDGEAHLGRDLRRGQPEVGSPRPIDVDGELGFRRIGLDPHVGRAGVLPQRLRDELRMPVQLFEVGPDHPHHDREVVAQAFDGRRVADRHLGGGEGAGQRRAGVVLDLADALAARLLRREQGAELDLVHFAVHAHDRVDVGDLGKLPQPRLGLARALAGQLQRGAVGQLEVDDHLRAILHRHELAPETARGEE